MNKNIIDWAFSFFHLILLIGVFIYAVVSLFMGNTMRFGVIMGCLAAYYFLVLHNSVMKEIRRNRKIAGTGEKKN